MGINKNTANIEKEILKKKNIKYDEISMCELGNQWLTFQRMRGKEYYKALGVKEHISIDLNGKDGSLSLNLDLPLPSKFINRFGLITNYGTIEHVNNQYQAFKNVHDITKVGGIIIHIMPMQGSMKGHGRYYYTPQFMKKLGAKCHYEIIDTCSYDDGLYSEIPSKNHCYVVLGAFLKKEDNNFISKEIFGNIEGLEDTGDLENTGNYEANWKYKLKRYKNLILKIIINPKRSYSKIKERIR
ncbi:MAG: class I SAM-dependent methyltransferase [Nanoarchaeota archaeon]|nr:class I SAM-dependent methyltransferase [Nanoarchaeota archaeon]MBU1988911.1 class I SAM-dependent methyltransferase [Nanoarchaeota archaeon]